MPALARKTANANGYNYKQTSRYTVPVVGLWIVFIVWMFFTNNSLSNANTDPIGSIANKTFSSKMGNTNVHSSEDFNNIKVMTWNLQGLKEDELSARTRAVISVIEKESPDVMFFQELVTSSYKELISDLEDLYANVIVMDRTKLVVKLLLRGRKKLKLALLTTHLESLPSFTEKRVTQLKNCFETCTKLSAGYNVIFGGDLNLEENEVSPYHQGEGDTPESLKDLWIAGGSSEETKYTWDATQNHNEKISDKNQQLKVRYDRLFYRSSLPETMKFEVFRLHGKDLVNGTSYHPSDHWALIVSFKVL